MSSTPEDEQLSATLPAFKNLFNFLEPYKLVIFAVLALCSPVRWGSLSAPIGWPWGSLSSLFLFDPWSLEPWSLEPWSYRLLLAGLALLSFVAPTATFHGPLRFGRLEYIPLISTFCWLPHGVLVFLFFPWSRYLMLWALPVGWQYVLLKYRENVRDIREKVDDARSRATVAISSAREYVKEATEYEKQALEVVAVARRDAMLAQSVKIIDFFDRAVESWAALGRVTVPAKDATNAAREVEEDARTVRECESPDDQGRAGALADMLLEKAINAVASAEDAENKARFAQATITESQAAQRQAAAARQQALTNSEVAANAAASLKDRIAETSATLFLASEGVEKVRKLADKATAAAVEGNKENALSLAAAAGSAADEVVNAKERLFLAKEGAHNILLELLLGEERVAGPP